MPGPPLAGDSGNQARASVSEMAVNRADEVFGIRNVADVVQR
jgi:hypothetical protein